MPRTSLTPDDPEVIFGFVAPTGAGTGDVIGPSSATVGQLAHFSNADGKHIASYANSPTVDSGGMVVIDPTDAGEVLQFGTGHCNVFADSNVLYLTADRATGSHVLWDENGNEVLKTSMVASAVNEVTILNAVTLASPQITTTGDDANIGLTLAPKGSGGVNIPTTTKLQLRDTASYLTSPSASSLDIESPTLRLNHGNPGDVQIASSGNDSLPEDNNTSDLGIAGQQFRNLPLAGTLTEISDIATAGMGCAAIRAEGISATKTANFTAVSYTPPATAGRYRVSAVITTTSSTNTGTLQMTVDYVDSQGTTHTADVIPAQLVSGTTSGYDADGTVTSATSKEFAFGTKNISINNAATAIAIKVVITGTVSYTVAHCLEQLG